MTVFYQALSESKNKNTKRTYEIWRKEVGEHRPYIDANKLANVRRDIINKKRLKETEIEDIKKTVRKQTKTEKPKPEDVAGKNGKLKTRAERKKALKFKYQLNMAQEENEQTAEATKAAKEIKKKAKQDYLDDMKKSQREEPLEGRYYLRKYNVDRTTTHKWLSSSSLKGETEGFILAADSQSLAIRMYQAKIFENGADRRCRLCTHSEQTIIN